jgi:hypothetical protein
MKRCVSEATKLRNSKKESHDHSKIDYSFSDGVDWCGVVIGVYAGATK